ncbi:unnamed protein product [Trichobilharzia szidati]|nr:unnamed protein product [Trichobilharzia szidati]CAH8864877.1 unnamed protein product [Trichobilharzia szidati]
MTSILSRVYSTVANSRNRYLLQCKKHLNEILKSGVLGAEAATLDVVELIPGDKYARIDVNCVLPVCNNFTTTSTKQTSATLAFRIQQYVNSGDSELRSYLHKNYPKMKIPIFQFCVTQQTYKVDVSSNHQKGIQSPTDSCNLSTSAKPNNVYGLERDKLLKTINSRLKALRKKSHPSEARNLVSEDFGDGDDDDELEKSISLENGQRDQNSTIAWAKFWKERQDWRSIARQERRRVNQSIGLNYLTHMNTLNK